MALLVLFGLFQALIFLAPIWLLMALLGAGALGLLWWMAGLELPWRLHPPRKEND